MVIGQPESVIPPADSTRAIGGATPRLRARFRATDRDANLWTSSCQATAWVLDMIEQKSTYGGVPIVHASSAEDELPAFVPLLVLEDEPCRFPPDRLRV